MRRVLLLIGLAAVLPACEEAPVRGDGFVDPGIETFAVEGASRVAVGTLVPYQTDPPTSGDHYPFPEPGGYYAHPVAAGYLVHSLAHGAVVIYADEHYVAPADLSRLQGLADEHPGDFAQVVVVPRTDAVHPVILTAWTHRLRLTLYDPARIDGFLSLFLGRGPEDGGSGVVREASVSP